MQFIAVQRSTHDVYIVQNDSPFPKPFVDPPWTDTHLVQAMLGVMVFGMDMNAVDYSKLDFDVYHLPNCGWVKFDDNQLIHKLEKLP